LPKYCFQWINTNRIAAAGRQLDDRLDHAVTLYAYGGQKGADLGERKKTGKSLNTFPSPESGRRWPQAGRGWGDPHALAEKRRFIPCPLVIIDSADLNFSDFSVIFPVVYCLKV